MVETAVVRYTPREYVTMALVCGSQIELSNATQAELDALVWEYAQFMAAAYGRN